MSIPAGKARVAHAARAAYARAYRRFPRRGLGIVVWHEERPEELRELVQLDVDGICTNTPDVLASILRMPDSRSPMEQADRN